MYISGLKDYSCVDIELWKPNTIEDARSAIRLIKQKNRFSKTSFIGFDKSRKYSK